MLILSRVQFAGVELSLKIGCNILNSLSFYRSPRECTHYVGYFKKRYVQT